MYVLILSRNSEEIVLMQNLFNKENCKHKTVSMLSDLEREIRIEFPDFLLIDSKYFITEQANAIDTKNKCRDQQQIYLVDIIFPVNIRFPIYFFDINQTEFTQYYDSEYDKSTSVSSNEIVLLLTQVKNTINTFIESSQNQFRPAEKKLYLLLKDKNRQAISIEQMAESLWGCSNKAHIKTVYSYIYHLKHKLEKNEYSPEWLIKEKKGYYKIVIRRT